MRRDRSLVRASDIGLYAFCARAWWLAQVQKAAHDDPARLTQGGAFHAAHGEQVRRIEQARLAALVLISAGVILLLALFFVYFSGQ